MSDNGFQELEEKEKVALEMYIKKGKRTDNDVKQFIEILMALREHPDANPQISHWKGD